MDNHLLSLIASSWVIVIGINLILCYFMYERNRIYNAIGNFLISFSIIKRTKSIILSYGLLATFIGVIGLLVTLTEVH